MLTASGIRMVIMNTNIYYKSNDALNLTTDVDPTGQLDWLESVLASAVVNEEKVGHVIVIPWLVRLYVEIIHEL